VFYSCGEEKKEPHFIEGRWVEVSEADTNEFVFLSNELGNTFIENGQYNVTTSGSWQIENNILTLEFVEPKSTAIDSFVLASHASGEVVTEYYENNKLVAEVHEGVVLPKSKRLNIALTQTGENTLSLLIGKEKHEFNKVVLIPQSISLWSIFRGIIGIMSLLLITFLFSGKRNRIDWPLVIKGTLLQILIAILVLKVPIVEEAFHWVSKLFVDLISMTDVGVDFLFGQMGIGTVQAPLITFAIKVLPTIIFFSALMSMLYYLGILQKIVFVFAWVMKKFMRLSGAESLAAAGNVFLGQTESPLLVKPYLLGMTKSEMMCLMTGGMATIAGGVLAAYVNFLGGDDPVQQAFFAKHLLTASIISAPAAIVASKILVPETEEINQELKIDKQKIGTNILEAISNGTTDGLKLAVNVGAMLLVFIALMALGNSILGFVGDISGLNQIIADNTPYQGGLSFQFILGYIGAPIVWLIGVDGPDIVAVGELLGQKTVLNEFVAYPSLGEMKEAGRLSEKSIIMSTYMLCGFANFASIGIQIGGIGSLVPSRKGLLSELGMKALLGGTIASLMTAAIVGMLF
jgi:CNT family concentrative nucleoside transporter